MTLIMQAIVGFLLTYVLGSRLTAHWQQRASKQQRYHDALMLHRAEMVRATQTLAELVGKRFYRTQRVLFNYRNVSSNPRLKEELSEIVVEWNERSVEISLDIRAYFENSYLNDFERLQSQLANVTSLILSNRTMTPTEIRQLAIYLSDLRSEYLAFVQGMLYEQRDLDREMYFGVEIRYDRKNLVYWSTWELFKALFVARIQLHSVLRAPSDLGVPQAIWKARSRIDKH